VESYIPPIPHFFIIQKKKKKKKKKHLLKEHLFSTFLNSRTSFFEE
jgi:hypothetical protein